MTTEHSAEVTETTGLDDLDLRDLLAVADTGYKYIVIDTPPAPIEFPFEPEDIIKAQLPGPMVPALHGI